MKDELTENYLQVFNQQTQGTIQDMIKYHVTIQTSNCFPELNNARMTFDTLEELKAYTAQLQQKIPGYQKTVGDFCTNIIVGQDCGIMMGWNANSIVRQLRAQKFNSAK